MLGLFTMRKKSYKFPHKYQNIPFFFEKLLIAFIIVLVLNPNELVGQPSAVQIHGSVVAAAVAQPSCIKHATLKKRTKKS